MQHIQETDVIELSSKLGALMREKGLTISTAESCTGGLIAHYLTMVSGSSAYFKGSVVSYCNEIKMRVLGVSGEAIEKYTEVSGVVAKQMAEGVADLMGTDISLSTTGIAGPTGELPDQPVGTVWIGVHIGGKTIASTHFFPGEREDVIEQASVKSLRLLYDALSTY